MLVRKARGACCGCLLTLLAAGCGGDPDPVGASASGAGGSASSTSASGGAASTAAGEGGSGAHAGGGGSVAGSGGEAAAGAGGSGGAGELCGGGMCRADQDCIAGVCTFACTGATVPGDYATIQAAVTALGDEPGSVICLAAQTYIEDFVLYATGLTIIGVSASETVVSVAPSWTVRGNVAFKGISFTDPVHADGFGSVIDFEASRLEQTLHVQRESFTGDNAGVEVHVDGCELLQGLYVHEFQPDIHGDYKVDIENSYIHDASGSGVRVALHHSFADIDLRVANNTIVGCDKGLDISVTTLANATTTLTASLFNNIVAGSASVGIAIDDSGAVSDSIVSTGNNAVYDNTVNYSGTASDGPGYVKQSCLLDAASPPGLQPGSPCLGAADPAQAPADDFWGTVRPPTPDIGAIEMP